MQKNVYDEKMNELKTQLVNMVMDNKDMRKLIETESNEMTNDKTLDMMLSIIDSCGKDDFQKHNRFEQISYISHESYVRGFMIALYYMNESYDEFLKDIGVKERNDDNANIQTRKEERH